MTAHDDVDAAAERLAHSCAKFYGDVVPETFDMTLSKLLARAAIICIIERWIAETSPNGGVRWWIERKARELGIEVKP